MKAAEYAGIYFTGGHGTMWDFPYNKELQRMTASIYEKAALSQLFATGRAAY
ncbi:hypothetical protein [Planococcus sp. MB-3u-03]|uniref:hypothetical protein n=1 Tax=Planococcus sp. MB-3u-03 TaxID=2058136 RepID=UPI0012FE8010|nr:hypothetical protein [Planococcus sp. MB-3u-03]